MSTISASTTTTTAYTVTADTTGALVIQTGAGPTTAVTVDSSQNVTFAGYANLPNTFGFKNRIINGAMVFDQRNNGASITPAGNVFTTDRWQAVIPVASKLSFQQVTTAPADFSKSLRATSLSAYSVGASESFRIQQGIEANNIVDFAWGTSSAQSATLSFRVYSSLTGTFGGCITDSVAGYSYPFSYTVSSANTWTTVSISIPGPTSGNWGSGNGSGLYLVYSLGTGSTYIGTANAWTSGFYVAGSTNLVSTNGATFYITGVQLEKGSTATSFDYRPYGTELALCQRYYIKMTVSGTATVFGSGFCSSTTTALYYTGFPATMRTIPTSLEQSGTASDYRVRFAGTAATCSTVPIFSTATNTSGSVAFTVASGLTTGQGTTAESNSANAYLAWSAEL